MRKRSGLAIVAAAFLALTNRSFAQSPIVLNELMYNPPDSLEMGEYVELYNAGYGAVDLSQWQVTDGIDFTFPPGTVLDEGDYLVVCRDAAHIRSAYGINNAIGDFSGRLSNSGDQLRLVNSVGMIMDELRYDERNPWPASANGVGYSLELRDPSLDNQQASSWSGSLTRLGTPGKRNSVFQDRTEEIVTLIKPGDLWRFFRGWTPPSDPADAWRQLGFDDSSWEEGPSGFGAGDGDDATILSDMQNNYVSVYIRKEFTLDNASLLRNTRLTVDYDDGFVAYLNGGEIVRRGMGEPGTPVFHDTTASISHEAGSPESFDLGTLSGLLRTGTNLLAIECHNESYTNGDLSLIPTLQVDCSPAMLLINEFRCEPEGWVEVCGPSSESVDVGGYFLTDDPADLTRFRIPEPTLTDEAGFAAFDKDYLGFPMPATGGILLLVAPDGKTVLDSFAYGQQQPGMSYGRYPDRSPNWYFLQPPTKGQPNHATFPSDVVINEIMYHTSLPDAHDEYIELYNRGEDAVDLGDWELTGAVRFTFPPGASIPPGGYLVVAESAFALSARYGISGVLGDFSGKLRNYGEKLVLLDALGNPADAVHYADESPWPLEPDGHGPSLELTHPELDNSFGQLWAPSDAETAPEGTPGAPNSTLGMPSPPAIVQTRHAPAVPSSADTVTVTTRVIDDGTVGAVSLFFRRDGEPDFSEVPMAPQGAGSPNDEVYKADLPAEADGTVIQFYIRATDDSSNESLFPDDAPTRTCLYLVDDTLEPSDAPLYRVLLTDANYTELRTRGVTSNVLLDATFICGDRVWYNVGLRYRGYGSRGIGEPNMSYRVRFNEGAPFGQVRKLNLNGQRPASQAVGWDFARRVGIPYSETKLAYLKLNDSFRGIRIQVEAVDEDYLRRVFSEDSSGNLYRGEGHYDRTGKTYGADFIYRGEDPDAYAPYQKQTNVVENDFTDIIHLCDVFTNTPDDQFEQAIGQVINVEEWITYFAVNTSLNNKEGAIYRDTGDDYFIYHYPFDGKWYLIPWDLDTVLDDPTESIFRQTVPMIVRFLSAPSFRLMYYRKLQHLLDYEFSERQMFPAIDSLQGKFGASTLQGFKDVVTGRIADIRGQIVTELTIEPPEFGIEYIRRGDEWHFFRGKEPPSDPPDAWKEPDFDDSLWETGPSGFGFGDNDDATVLSDMQGSYFSVYIRKEFTLSSPDQIGSLQLEVDYDDGFIAYLNGEKVAWGNMPQGDVSYNTPASNNSHEAGTPELFDLTQFIGLLRDGKNVLAIEGHNGTLNSSDVSLIPELRSLAQVVLSRGRWIVRDAELTLTGTAPIVLAETVTVNGLPAEYDLGHGTWSAKISLAPGLNRLVVAALAPGGQTVDTKTIEVVYIPPDRVLGGELTSNVLWTKEPSPYVLAETVVVLPGATLTIEPGTEVLLADAQSLLVEGRLLANGTENDPITFTTYRDGESWGNLAFDQALSSELSHCIVEYSSGVGSYGGLYAGAVALVGSHLDVNECTFRNFPDESPAADASGIYLLSGASATIRNSRFRCMGAGVHTDHNYVLVENCIFTDIHGSGNDPVDVNGESTPVPVIKNNLFMSSEDDGIDMDRCSPIILGNFIRSSADKGISVGKGSDPRIANNVVVANATGIAVMDGANPLLINNTIVGNAIGLECYEKTSGQGGGMGSVANCILWENDTEILLDALSSPTVSYSLVRGDPVWAGKGNINADPLFLDAGNLDFHLTKLSPCIDAGDQQDAPPDDFDGNARPRGSGFDMGAHESPYWVFVDTDADQMADGWEEHYFSSLAQGAQDDFDQDGMNDLAEYDAGADPTSSDTDADGLPDGWEWANGLSPIASTGDDGPNGDRDRDGMSNLAEYIAGTSPNDPQSVFEIASVVANGDSVGLTWPAHKTKEYRVLVSTDLLFWTEEATIPPGGERQAEWFDNNSNGKPRQFYKLEVLP